MKESRDAVNKERTRMLIEKAEMMAQMEKHRAEAELRREKQEAIIVYNFLCELIKKRMIHVTPEFMKSVTDPAIKKQLIEAICLSKI